MIPPPNEMGECVNYLPPAFCAQEGLFESGPDTCGIKRRDAAQDPWAIHAKRLPPRRRRKWRHGAGRFFSEHACEVPVAVESLVGGVQIGDEDVDSVPFDSDGEGSQAEFAGV